MSIRFRAVAISQDWHGFRIDKVISVYVSTRLIGEHLLVYLNADDLRCVRAFLSDGTELGVLDAQGAWRVVPHNLKLRQEIRKLKGKRHGSTVVGANPIEAYVQTKLEQAKKTRKAATELAHAVKLLASAPTVRTPVGPTRPVETGMAESTATQTVSTSPTVTA